MSRKVEERSATLELEWSFLLNLSKKMAGSDIFSIEVLILLRGDQIETT
jgi:hypothetical protein